jgi:DMSO/TMAO reductase YedYZ molybdopterin-dependent catalytic subunit
LDFGGSNDRAVDEVSAMFEKIVRKHLVLGFFAGLIGGVFMTLLMLTLRYLIGASTLPEMISDRAAPFLPIPVFFKMLDLFGGYSHLKQIAVVSTFLALVGFAGGIGVLYAIAVRPSRPPESSSGTQSTFPRAGMSLLAKALSITWLLSVILLWPTLQGNYKARPPGEAIFINALNLLLLYVTCGLVMAVMYRFLTGRSTESSDAGRIIDRRSILPTVLAAIGVVAVVALLRKFYAMSAYDYDGTEETGTDLPPITPNEDFYCVTKNNVDPQPAMDLWRLEVTGMVTKPRTYRFEEIAAMPFVDQETTLECISNQVGSGLMSNAIWRGVPLRDLIAAAGLKPGIKQVLFHGADAYTDDLSFEIAMRPTTLVAYQMNGTPLPFKHGFPVRIVVPGMVGEKNVKWVTRIEFLDHETKGFYEKQGWGPSFRINTTSRFDAPDFEQPIKFGSPIVLRGTAFGGERGVSRVEVSTDDGASWQTADLTYKSSPLAWVQWQLEWSPTAPGKYSLVVRATDGSGEAQSRVDKPSGPEPATGYHRVQAILQS